MDYSGMTVNERLFESGLMGKFDKAIEANDKILAISILKDVSLEQKDAENTVETIFANTQKYGYKS